MTDGIEHPKATRREWVGLAVIALPCLLYSMDLTVLNLAVPSLSADLRPTSSQLLWIVDIYGFLVAGSLITMGTLGDRVGRRKLLLIGAAAFGIASVFAAFARTAEQLILARALLGIAAATLAPSTLSLIRNMFLDTRERTFAIGVWIASFSAGGAIGPLIGGVLLEFFWWGSVFLVAVPVMVMLLVVGPKFLPEYRDENAGRLDIPSAALSLVAVLAVIYGMKHVAEHGFGLEAGIALLLGIIAGTAFARRQLTLAQPLIDLSLFRRATFSGSLAINILGAFVAFGSFLFIAQYLQLVLGMGPLQAGLWTAPSALMFIVGSMVTPLLIRRVQPAYLMAGGLTISAIGLLILTGMGGPDRLAYVITGYCVFAIGLTPVFALTTEFVITSVPPEKAGVASGISETSSELGGALGIAVLGSIITAVYRDAMTGAAPAGVPHEAMETARNTLGGAVAVAGEQPGEMGLALLAAARDAFTQAFEVTTLISAMIVVVGALVPVLILRRPAPAPATLPDGA